MIDLRPKDPGSYVFLKRLRDFHGIFPELAGWEKRNMKKTNLFLQGGPLPVISGVISPINGLING